MFFPTVSLFLFSCSSEDAIETQKSTSPLTIRTTSYPVHYLVEQMSQGHKNLDLSCIFPVGEDPSHWNPNAEEVLQLQEADLIISNGAHFEPWLQNISVEQQNVVNSSKGIQLIEIEGETHSHGKGGSHSHGRVDPYTWLDPKSYIQQARNIKDALIKEDQTHRGLFEDSYVKLENDLQQLNREMLNVTTKIRRYQLAANHPTYNYFAKRFTLQIQNFDFDPKKVPSKKQIQEFHVYTKSVHENGKPAILLWENQPLKEVEVALQPQDPAIEVIHVVVPSLEHPDEGDLYNYMTQSTANIKIFENLILQLQPPIEQPQ